jgi:isoleucyl-tRNA synthetase
MSKRLGNAVDPFETIGKFGPDATRWYLMTNSQPWDNLKFDLDGISEVQRKFFGTLYNTYAFFALYANIDGFTNTEKEVPFGKRPEIDRWILSELNSLIRKVESYYEDFEPTKAGRAIQDFVIDHLSNWYVRLSRRRFWKGDYSDDKIAAYQTLYRCLEVIAQLGSPIAPFFMERLFTDLNEVTGRIKADSVHLTDFPLADESQIDLDLEERMELAQKIASMILSLRKRSNIRVRQPLNKIMVPILNEHNKAQLKAVENLILSEVNVKEIDYLTETAGILVKKIKPNFKTLGPRFGKLMKPIAAAIDSLSPEQISQMEEEEVFKMTIDGELVEITLHDVEITTEDIPGWLISSTGNLTVALDINITDDLKKEGLARELINRIQNLRKDRDYEVTDKIRVQVEKMEYLETAIQNNLSYICAEILAESLDLVDKIEGENQVTVELTEEFSTRIKIERTN